MILDKKLIIVCFLSSILSIICLKSVSAQDNEIKFTQLTNEDGLSSNIITKIFQDSKGFLWFGTYNGLNRYDGYNFKIFLPEPSNPQSISNHSISSINEDKSGNIWIGTNDGLNKYDWKTGLFHRYKHNPKDPHSLSHNYIWTIFKDKAGALWIGTADGLNRYNPANDNFEVYKIDTNFKNVDNTISITSIEEDNNNNLWLGSWHGLMHITKNGELLNHFLNDQKNPRSICSNAIKCIKKDGSGNLWIGTDGKGLDSYDDSSGIFTHYVSSKKPNSLSNNYIRAISTDNLGNIWIGTKEGLNKLNPGDKKFKLFFHDPLNPLSLLNNEIYSLGLDKTDITWVGTSGGVSRFYQPQNKFLSYLGSNSKVTKLISNRVNSIYIDRAKNILAGTKEGLIKIIQPGGKIFRYTHETGLADNYVKTTIEDHLGLIWIGTDGGGLNCLNPFTGEFKLYNSVDNDSGSLSSNGVPAVMEDSKGNIWVGTYFGLDRFNRKTGKFEKYYADFSNPNSLKNSLIWTICEDSKGMIWCGTDGGGVSRLNPASNQFTNFMHDTTNPNNIIGNRIFAIYETSDGIMWFGTSEGLSRYDRTTGIFTNYTWANGLPSNACNSFIEDKKKNLWISTDKGLSKFNTRTEVFENYTKRNGLPETEFSPNAAVRSDNGNLFFASTNGIIFFNPDDLTSENITAPVILTDLKIYNQSVPISPDGILRESITNTKTIRIPQGNEVITFEFAMIDYFDIKKNAFQYKLEGFDIGWNDVGTRNNATYTNLPPGEYKFRVKGSNNRGIKSDKEASIQIIIIPAFYQAWWFRITFGLGTIFSALFIFQTRTRSIQNRNKILENKVNERTKDLDKTIEELSLEIVERKKAEEKVNASLGEKELLLAEKEVLLKEIHHRVKNNLQVISSLLYLNSRKIKDKEVLNMFKESQNRVKSIALVHERLYRSKDLGRIDFKEYIQHLTHDLFRSYAVNQSVILLELNINEVLINIDTAVPCGLIINELISNSLKHAFPGYEENNKTGLIKINFNKNDNGELALHVGDNGIGMPDGLEEKKKLSLGLQLVETLVGQLEGTLEIDLHGGTTFKINFINPAN